MEDKETLKKISDIMQKASGRCMQYNKILVSLSGGSDSDIMLDVLYRAMNGDISRFHFIFIDTGIEWTATLEHIKYLENRYNIKINIIKGMSVPYAVKEYGYPFRDKDLSAKLNCLQNNNFDFANDGYKDYDYLIAKYPSIKSVISWWCQVKKSHNITNVMKAFLIENPPPFKISKKCCVKSKVEPSERYEKEQDIDLKCLGFRRDEHGLRSTKFHNCFEYDSTSKMQNFRPIYWLDDKAKEVYEKLYDIQHSECYTKYGMKRTGCFGCPYNSNYKQDLETAKIYEPQKYKGAMAIWKQVYDYHDLYLEFKKNYKNDKENQISIFDIIKEVEK